MVYDLKGITTPGNLGSNRVHSAQLGTSVQEWAWGFTYVVAIGPLFLGVAATATLLAEDFGIVT